MIGLLAGVRADSSRDVPDPLPVFAHLIQKSSALPDRFPVLSLRLIADQDIEPAKDQDIEEVDRDQVEGPPLRKEEIDCDRDQQEEEQKGKKESQELRKAARLKEHVIKPRPAKKRRLILPKHCLEAAPKLLVLLVYRLRLRRNPPLHP